MKTETFQSRSSQALSGTIQIPGDKSISHRAIMLAAISDGVCRIRGFLEGMDCLATVQIFRDLGVKIEGPKQGDCTVFGVGLEGLQAPSKVLDCGNSGTSMRLLTGLLAGQSFASTLTGDASLQKRPMARVVDPLREMGASITMTGEQYPPLSINPATELQGIRYQMPIASAQVKSSLLLAGLYAKGTTTVIESAQSRDHTERMLRGFGVAVHRQQTKDGLWETTLTGQQPLTATDFHIPGDVSSAAFFMVAATLVAHSSITLTNVGMNPTRIGCIEILNRMGASIRVDNERNVCGEPVADCHIQAANLHGITIDEALIPLAIDEFPILFIAAACAKGQTLLRGAKELRVKESDRISVMARGLQTLGIDCEELSDGIAINGGGLSGGTVDSKGDHRIAMAFAIAGLVAKEPITILDCENVRTSFPNFVELANKLGAFIEET